MNTDKIIEEGVNELFPKLEGNTTRNERIELLKSHSKKLVEAAFQEGRDVGMKADEVLREEGREAERENLRVHIEREVIDPLIDDFKKSFGTDEAIDRLREILRD